MKTRIFAYALLLSTATPAFAQPPVAEPFTASQAYRNCTSLASTDAPAALARADEWLKIDRSVAPHHCRAMALYGLRRFAESALELIQVRQMMQPSAIEMRSYVSQQAARAWMEAGKPQEALGILTVQINELTLKKNDNITQSLKATELLMDRARIRITYGQLVPAVQDLDQAISLSPANEEILMQRAKVFTQLGDKALAQQDLQAVLRMNPKHTEALGLMRVLRDTQPQA